VPTLKNSFLALVLSPLLSSLPCQAFRTAIFSPELRSRTAVWLDQDRIFDAERGNETARPIWVHSGDSLASAWADQHTLREKLARAETEELPSPGSIADIFSELPSPRFTWYAGSDFNYGLLGDLDRQGLGPWVVLSSALAGARLTPLRGEDALNVKIKHPERVRLVTLSLGGNDLCQELDPAQDSSTLDRIRAYKAGFSAQAHYVAWAVPDLAKLQQSIAARIAKLPPTPGRERLASYCHDMWFENMCPALKTTSAAVLNERRARLNKVLEQEFGALFDPYANVAGHDPLDLMGGDCFHPSRLTEKALSEALAKFLEVHYGFHS
jgi:lysophospholipase L1-like esterase